MIFFLPIEHLHDDKMLHISEQQFLLLKNSLQFFLEPS